MAATRPCKCGCGELVPCARRYVDKRHQLSHMRSGEASRMNQQQPLEGKRRGGAAAGRLAADSGALAARGLKGAARVREIAAEVREECSPART